MTDRSGYDKMRAGQIYAAPDPYLISLQAAARLKLLEFNATPAWDLETRRRMLADMLGAIGESFVLSPITWEYGRHIRIGNGVFINFECVFLDGADITIGDGTAIAPRVQFLTAGHPLEPGERTRFDPATGARIGGNCINRPISIGRDCWIGAGAIILGGVSIGDGTTIGAGSVVTRDVPAGVVAAGNPCRVIRRLRAGEQQMRAANAA